MTTMLRRFAWCLIFCAAITIPVSGRQAGASLFAGEWVGLQTWTVENPSAGEPQTVTVRFVMSESGLTGAMTPVLGAAESVPLTDIQIEGDDLSASFDFSGVRNRWQRAVTGTISFTRDADRMSGTANLAMGDVPWLNFEYQLNRKQARYPNAGAGGGAP